MEKKLPLWKTQTEGFAPSLTCFPVEGSKGAVVVCPGGGYSHKADHEGAPIARAIAAQGVSAFVLDYHVSPIANPEDPLNDARRAIRVVRAMGYEKVAILGFSAGGHLCAAVAVHSDNGNPEAEDPVERLPSRPDAFFPCYGVLSFQIYRNSGTMKNLLTDKAEDRALARYYSPELHVTPDTPEAFLWHTAADNGVPVECALTMAKALSAQGVPYEMHIFPEGRHGLGLATETPGANQWMPLLGTWLKLHGYR